MSEFGSKTADSTVSTNAPLSRDITNLSNGSSRSKERAASPKMQRSAVMHNRTRLRRSRSACEMRALKQTEPTLAPIPAKSIKFGQVSSSSSSSSTCRVVKPSRSSALTSASANKKTAVNARLAIKSSSTTTTATTKSASATSVSTTGAGKPVIKGIPVTARDMDLWEKHKLLEEHINNWENLAAQLEETQSELITTKEQLQNAQTEKECLQTQIRQIRSLTLKWDKIANLFARTKEELEHLQESCNIMDKENSALEHKIINLCDRSDTLTIRNKEIEQELESCKEQLFRLSMQLKELHNTRC